MTWPTASLVGIMAGKSTGSMFIYPRTSSNKRYAHTFLATVDIIMSANNKNLAQKYLELTDYEIMRGILCKEHALALRLRTNTPIVLDTTTLWPTEETHLSQTNRPTESDEIYTVFPSPEVP